MAQGSEVGLVSLQTHTQNNEQRPSQWCPVMFCIQSRSVHPQNTHCCPRGLDPLSLLPPTALSLSLFSFPFFISTAKQIPSSRSHLYPKLCLSQRASAISSLLFSAALFSFLVFVTKQSLTPTTPTGPTVTSRQTTVLYSKLELCGLIQKQRTSLWPAGGGVLLQQLTVQMETSPAGCC